MISLAAPGRFLGGGRGSPFQYASIPGMKPGESHGQRSLAGYSPEGCKESDVTEHACMYTSERRSYHLLSATEDLVTSEAIYLPKTFSCKAGGVRFESGSI